MTTRWRSRPPYTATVVRDRADEFSTPVDWSSWYLTDEEDMGQSPEQDEIVQVFTSVLRQVGRELEWGKRVLIGNDAFFAWLPEHPLVRVSPDIYLLFDPPPPPLPASWQTWLHGHRPPALAVEIVSGDEWKKDYEEGPEKYAQLGASELLIFDPAAMLEEGGDRLRLQVYQRTDDGLFVRQYAGPGTAALKTLNLYALACRTPAGPRLRLARDREGIELVPTAEEAQDAAEAARQEAEAARQEAEAARAAERAAREEAERELARLREQLGGRP
ncbi:MAG: Uma2 family endonuclease [Planctomycetes bacterium]|nr:Uma2 family endonuclease [Planctomycetota bacterium]